MRFRAALNRLTYRTMPLRRRTLLTGASAATALAFHPVRAADTTRIVCPLAAEPKLLIPGLSDEPATRLIGSKIYRGLCRFSAAGDWLPDLATSVQVSSDGLTYTFRLLRDAIWHDSGALTSDDVVFSIDHFHRRLQPGLGLDRVKEVRALDPVTVSITLDAPFEPFLRQLDGLSMPIVPRHVHDFLGFRLDPRETTPVGCGPFRVADWLRLVRFEWYSGPKPALLEIACPILPDWNARLARTQTGEPFLLAADAVDMAALPQLRLLETAVIEGDAPPSASAIAGLRINRAVKPLDDAQVRRAIASAINRSAVLREAWSGLGRVATGAVLGSSHDRDPAVTLPTYDPRATSVILSAAGLRPDDTGIRLRLKHLVPPGEPWSRLAELLQTMLRQVGIELTPEGVSVAEWRRRVASGEYETTGFVQNQTGDAALDLAGYGVPELTPLLAIQTDAATRLAALSKAQALLVESADWLWLVEPAIPVVRDRRLHWTGSIYGSFAGATVA